MQHRILVSDVDYRMSSASPFWVIYVTNIKKCNQKPYKMDRSTKLRNEVYKNHFTRWLAEEIVARRITPVNMSKPARGGRRREIAVYSGSLLFSRRFAVGQSHGKLFLAAQKRDLIGLMGAHWTHAYLEVTRHGLALCLEADNLVGGDLETERYFAIEIPIPSEAFNLLPDIRNGGEIYAIGMILNEKNRIIGIRKKYAFKTELLPGLYNPAADIQTGN
ncbi:hypothetical protein SAMN02744133_108153 [Thalassospira xiamenensis M-5 = DSM 17429]|nr:hypothetical protein SAMN02744133_108153 [Thalassospira xiamenensis M-5 = DSM 17429]